MNRKEFIEWLETSGMSREDDYNDTYWKEMMNYADYIYDYLEVKDDHVIFIYENMYWGGSDTKKDIYSFDDFKRLYESYSLK
jgi:hypothetical protein